MVGVHEGWTRQGDVGIADQQKTGKQGSDDSTKQFSTQLHLHIFPLLNISLHFSYFLLLFL